MKSFSLAIDEVDDFLKKNKQQRQENVRRIKSIYKDLDKS